MISGLNHLTLAVSELERSLQFYVQLLEFKPEAQWDNGAYLSAGNLWVCLSLGPVRPAEDYTHFAFSIEPERFDAAERRLREAAVTCWKSDKSEGASFYFLDPDGHKLELHCGNLCTRIASVRKNPYSGWKEF